MQVPCGETEARVWSLLNIMRVFDLKRVGFSIYLLKNDYDECRNRCDLARTSNTAVPDLSGDFKSVVLAHLSRAQTACLRGRLNNAFEQLRNINYHYTRHSDAADYHSLCADLRNALDAMLNDLRNRQFLEVVVGKEGFVNNDSLFGVRVSKQFRNAIPDIREAGNCIAADCPTAAVFHLMRVAEYGLRALAFDRRIKLDKNKPIDLATWEDLLRKLEDAEDQIKNFPKTHAREAQFDFFHGANMEIKRFKGKFRNRVMHSRGYYDLDEAMSAFNHVKAFMEILSSRISESTRTPIIWKGSKWTTS